MLINQGVNADVVVSTVKINPEKGGVEPKAKKDGAVAERQAETNCKGTVRGDVRCWKNEFVWMFGHVLLMHPSSSLWFGRVVWWWSVLMVSVDGQNRYRCLLLIPKVRVSMPGKLQEFVFFGLASIFDFLRQPRLRLVGSPFWRAEPTVHHSHRVQIECSIPCQSQLC